MENINIDIFVCLIIPMSMMLFMFKKESRAICIFLLIGMFICVLSGEINGFIANLNILDTQNISVNIAPLVEEFFKSLPIIFICFLLKPSKQQIAEYALSLGVGFATLENISILMGSNISLSYVFLRAIGAGMMHGICTLIVGLAMRNVIDKKAVYLSGTLAALSISVIYHSIYNMLITSKYVIVGVMLPIVTFITLIVIDKINNKDEIKE